MTQIYNYDRVTGEFINEQTAQLDPIDKAPLIPAFSTTKKPPVPGSNEAVVFANGVWSVVPDHRGRKYFLADKTEHVIKNIGEALPVDALDQMPAETESEQKQKLIASVASWATQQRVSIAGAADAYKLAGWADKAQRAKRFADGAESADDKAILQKEVDKRGLSETLSVLAGKQSAKAKRLASAVAIIDGAESAMEALITSTPVGSALITSIDNMKTAAHDLLNAL